MLKYCSENWNLNKEELRKHLKSFSFVYNNWEDFIGLIVKYIFPKQLEIEKFLYLTYSGYSGEILTILREKNTYSKEKIFLSHTYFNVFNSDENSYDALSAAEDMYSEENTINNLMRVAYQFIQNIIQPWLNEEEGSINDY